MKNKAQKKLTLNKTTVSNLGKQDMNNALGGGSSQDPKCMTIMPACWTNSCGGMTVCFTCPINACVQ